MKNLSLLFLPFLVSCGLSLELVEKDIAAPDYTKVSSWAAHPEKLDWSDSSFTSRNANQFDIPVFFVSPTIYFPKRGGTWNLDPTLEKSEHAFDTPIKYQSTAFNIAGPVYSPTYRQSAYQVYEVPPNTVTKGSYQMAYADVESAFEEFQKRIGPEQPFILASHSQGTDHLIRLISKPEFEVYTDRLVAAYLVGMPVDNCSIPLPLCQSPDQTGCYTSWRTHHLTSKVYNKYPVACIGVTNPISWEINSEYLPKTANKEALINADKKLLQQLVSAQIKNGVIVTERPQFPGSFLIRTKNYHRGDINLYYGSIQENVIQRCRAYLKAHSRP